MRGLSPVAASGGHSSSRCVGLSPSWPLSLRSTGSRRAGSAAVAHGPSCSAACGILPDQGSNPHPPHRQADSQPLHHQGSPIQFLIGKTGNAVFSSLKSRYSRPQSCLKNNDVACHLFSSKNTSEKKSEFSCRKPGVLHCLIGPQHMARPT